MKTCKSVDDYVAAAPVARRSRLRALRATIKKAAPTAEEGIAYGMPAYKLAGRPLVYFATFARHDGFFGTPTLGPAFAKQLARYKQGRGSIQFPHDEPLPLPLVARMVKHRVAENVERAVSKAKPAKRAPARPAKAASKQSKPPMPARSRRR